jgi:hypothetical protein
MTIDEALDHFGGRDERGSSTRLADAIGIEPLAVRRRTRVLSLPPRANCG